MKTFRIIHFSDLHEAAPLQRAGAFFDKRVIGRLNSLLTRRFDRENIRRAVPLFLKQKPDLFVFTGDATTCSQPIEFEMTLEDLSPLIRSGIPILYTPGNHDAYVKAEECRAALAEFTLKISGEKLESFPVVKDFGPVKTLSVHSALPTMPWLSSGMLSEKSEIALREFCVNKVKPLLLISHFPVFQLGTGIPSLRRKLYGAERLHALPLDLVLCGHIHRPYCLPRESDCGSLAKFGVYSRIEFNDGRFQIFPEKI